MLSGGLPRPHGALRCSVLRTCEELLRHTFEHGIIARCRPECRYTSRPPPSGRAHLGQHARRQRAAGPMSTEAANCSPSSALWLFLTSAVQYNSPRSRVIFPFDVADPETGAMSSTAEGEDMAPRCPLRRGSGSSWIPRKRNTIG